MIRNLVSAEGVKMCQTLCHLASLVPDPDVATSDVSKSVHSGGDRRKTDISFEYN